MEKQVLVHVGPPKTGSSAIQKWCVDNIDLLGKHGVMYPVHELDSNGVSSGNIDVIFDRVQSKTDSSFEYVLSKEKLNEIISRFLDSEYKVLLFSSEFFITKMDDIISAIPSVKFVGYLRNPIEVIEANYNQGVKRSGFTEKINLKTFTTFPHVGFIELFLKKNNRKSIELRIFNPENFSDYDVVSDFLRCFLSITVEFKKHSVNNSYDFRALEFKRWLNRYRKREFFSYEVDRILQMISFEKLDYSLVPFTELNNIKQGYVEKINKIYSNTGIIEFLDLLEVIDSYSPSVHKVQSLSKKEFIYILHLLSENMGQYSYLFYKELEESLDTDCIYSIWFKSYYNCNVRVALRYYSYRFNKLLKGI